MSTLNLPLNFRFLFNCKEVLVLLLLLHSLPPLIFFYYIRSNSKEGLLLLVLLQSPSSSDSTSLFVYFHPATSSELLFPFELEVGNDYSTVSAVPPSFLFYSSFAFEFEGGTDPSSVAAVPPSSVITALLISVHHAPSCELSFSFSF